MFYIAKINVTIIALLTFIKTVKFIAIHIKILVLVVLTSMTLSSCKKDGDLAPVIKTAALNTVNASINPINVYQNGIRLNNLGSFGIGGQSGYFSVASGMQQYQIKKAGAGTPEYLISEYAQNLDTDMQYTLFVAGETADKLFLIQDTSEDPVSGKAMVRFVNTLPGATNLNASIGSLNFTNTAFKSASAFTNVNSGTNSLKIYQSGSATPVIDQTITLAPGIYYTIFTSGTLTGTGADKFTARMIIN